MRKRLLAVFLACCMAGVNGISVGPCFAEHNYTAGKEGSMGRMDGCFTAYLTAYSTFDRTISLRAVPSKYDQA